MKTAVFLSGQPRFMEECASNILDKVIKPNNADVFIHYWNPVEGYNYKYSSSEYDPNWSKLQVPQDIGKKIIDIYQPKECVGENPVEFCMKVPLANSIKRYYWGVANLSSEELDKWTRTHIRNSLSMWYSINQAFASIPKDTYDCVIRCRFDLKFGHVINVQSCDLTKINYIDLNQPPELISDWFGVGSYNTMAKYAAVYNNWQFLLQNCNHHHDSWCNESMLGMMMDTWEIPRKPQSWHVELKRM